MRVRRSVGWLVPASVGAFALAACAEVQDVGSTAAERADASSVDAGNLDASARDAAGDASAADATVNLVTNASFEDGIALGNCGTGWNFKGTGTFATSTLAHEGSASCEVCGTVPGVAAILYAERPMPDAGATLVPAAWLRGVAGSAPDGGVASAAVAVEGCFPYCTTILATPATPDAGAWELQNGTQEPVGEGGMPTFFFEVHVEDGCVLVDDVSVIAQ